MSYDLYFIDPEISLQEFQSYFESRSNYNVENTQAWYANEDTGVYFCFDYSGESEEAPEGHNGNVSFNLNFYRPHFFALEAEPEVRDFVNHFGLMIHDPQMHGMGEGKYDTEGFLRGWNHGNEFGYNAVLNSEAPPEIIHSRSGDELESIWQWNFNRKRIQNTFGEAVFVPRIMFIRIDGSVLTAAVWPDAIPALIPQVDALVIPRYELAPRRLFRKKEDMCIVAIKKAFPLLEPFRAEGYAMPAFTLSYTAAPVDLSSFVKSLKPNAGQAEGVANDQVLNRELIEKFRKG